MVFAGIDSSDGVGGVVPAAVAAHLGLPYLSYAARIEPDMAARTVRVRRISATGYDLLEAPLPVVIGGTQALGEPRYPSLKGIMAARGKEIVTRSLADLGLDAASVGERSPRPPSSAARCHRPAAPRRSSADRPTTAPPGSSTSWPSGGSSDGRAVGRRRARARRRSRQHQRRSGDARPRAGRGRRPGRRRDRRGRRSGRSGRRPRHVPAARADRQRPGRRGSRLVGRGGRPHRRARRDATRPTRSSSGPGRMVATSPAPCRR